MDWTKDNKTYVPGNNVKGIVYKMTYNGYVYYGKKVIRNPKGKLVKYSDYYGSSKKWKEYIDGNLDKVKREVIYECIGKSEMHYYECHIICTTNALFDTKCMNANLNMVTTSAHTKNFINKPDRY